MSVNPLGAIDGGRAPGGWEALWERDRWPLRELPHGDLHGTTRTGSILFAGISQPWLEEAAKRWARARLLAGGSPSTMANYVQHVRSFSGWLAERAPEVRSPAGITRAVLEDWLMGVRSSGLAMATKGARVVAMRVFLEEQWDDGLSGLPRDAVIHTGEVPREHRWLPRGIEGAVFAQFIDPENLALLPCEQHRTVILLLAFTGLRISSIVTLRRDALQTGSDNHPYLRYLNVKLRREAVIPIGPALVAQLHRQEQFLTDTLGPDGTRFLLPSPPAGRRGGSRGEHHLSVRAVRHAIKRYVQMAEIRDGNGRLASWMHPHRFRHHLATSLVNEGIPLSVIQRVLDHGSIEMTARYSHLDDETVRREMASFHERVNIRGERIALPVGGPLEQAAWMKERIARAKQALPNGYCGLPLVQSCPHPNACLSCENFLTDSSFRQIHERQLADTLSLRKRAQQNENLRLVELLEGDERSLRRILEGLDAIDARSSRRRAAGRDRAGRPAQGQGQGHQAVSGRRAQALRGAATTRSLAAEERAQRALTELDRRGAAINFQAVAAEAGVSARFLYGHPQLRAAIEQLRGEQQRAPSRLSMRERASEESIRARLRGALEENKRLRCENAQLREELALAHGRVRELELDRVGRR